MPPSSKMLARLTVFRSTIQVFHSVDNAPLQAVTKAVANGKIHCGLRFA
jgi:hypothetical protein